MRSATPSGLRHLGFLEEVANPIGVSGSRSPRVMLTVDEEYNGVPSFDFAGNGWQNASRGPAPRSCGKQARGRLAGSGCLR